MASNKSVNVLAPNGRRQVVKVTPNTTILQILEEVCKKQGFKPEEFDLRHHNKVLDTSAVMRFSGLPNNAQLEISTAAKTREESSIVLGLVLESGDRLMGDFLPTVSLWDVITTLCPDQADPDSNPAIIYMRREVSGVKLLTSTTLRCLGLIGGRALLRFVHGTPEQLHRQANVSAPLQQRPVQEQAPAKQDTKRDVAPSFPTTAGRTWGEPSAPGLSPPSTLDHQPAMEVDESETVSLTASDDPSSMTASDDPSSEVTNQVSDSSFQQQARQDAETKLVGEIVLLGERNAIVFSLALAQSVPYEDLPEDFYDLTIEDARALYRDIKRARAEVDDAPLVTAAQRELEASTRVLTQLSTYKRTVLRVQFPDRTVLQGTFLPLETVSTVEQFVAQYLDDPTTQFHLFTTPPKALLASDARLVEVGCVPSAMLYFGLNAAAQAGSGKYLREELLTRLTSPTAAAFAAQRSRGLMDPCQPSSAEQPSSSSEPVASTSGTQSVYASATQHQRPNYGPSGKVPKWFKP